MNEEIQTATEGLQQLQGLRMDTLLAVKHILSLCELVPNLASYSLILGGVIGT